MAPSTSTLCPTMEVDKQVPEEDSFQACGRAKLLFTMERLVKDAGSGMPIWKPKSKLVQVEVELSMNRIGLA